MAPFSLIAVQPVLALASARAPPTWRRNMKLKKVLRAVTAAAVLTGAANTHAVPQNQLSIPWHGIIDLGNGSPYDVYYQVFADPNNTLCSNGPLTCTFLGSPIIAKQDAAFTLGPAYTGQ